MDTVVDGMNAERTFIFTSFGVHMHMHMHMHTHMHTHTCAASARRRRGVGVILPTFSLVSHVLIRLSCCLLASVQPSVCSQRSAACSQPRG